MEVTSVSASVRFSGAVGPSRFKTVELSAEATVHGQEDWQNAQRELYSQLGKQVKNLWLQGQKVPEGSEKAIEDIPGSDLTEQKTTHPHHQRRTTTARDIRLGSRDTSAVPIPGTATRPLTERGAGKSSPISPPW